MSRDSLPSRTLQPTHSAVNPFACATGARVGGRLNGGVGLRGRAPEEVRE
jgi:hypothetical protein